MLVMTMLKLISIGLSISFFLPNLLTSSNFGRYPSHNSLKSEETMFRTFSWLVIFLPATNTVLVLFSVAHIMLPMGFILDSTSF